MRVFRLSAIILFSIVLAAGLPYLGYMLYQGFREPVASPISAIPEKTALILRVNHPLDLYGELDRSNLIWKELANYPGIKDIQAILHTADSITRGHKQIRNTLKDNPLYISLSVAGRSDFSLLYLMPFPERKPVEKITEYLQETFPGRVTILTSPYATTKVLQIHFAGRNKPIFLSACKGLCLVSPSSVLVKKAIDRLTLNTPVVNITGLERVISASGKKTDANIFINVPYLAVASWNIVSEEYQEDLVRLARFADWSGLDIMIKKDEVQLTGYTTVSDTTFHTLARYRSQEPQKNEAPGVLPDNVAWYTSFGFQDFSRYFDRAQKEMLTSPVTDPSSLDLFNRHFKMKVESWFIPWIGSQFGKAMVYPEKPGAPGEMLTFIQTHQPDTAKACLKALAHKMGIRPDSVVYKDHSIFTVGLTPAVNAVFSNFYTSLEGECFTVIGNFILLAGSRSELMSVIDHFLSGTTLGHQRNYMAASEDFSGTSNIFFFGDPSRCLGRIPGLFTAPMQTTLSSIADSLRKFESVTLQMSNQGPLVYTSMALRFNPRPTDEGPLAWSAELDTLVSGTPQIVHRNISGQPAILVTDTLNTLYQVDSVGNILWKEKLYGRILGRIHEIRLEGDDSLYYLFNTPNHLYLVRSDGELADRFPLKFPLTASNGIAVTDYNNSLDYRILVAFKDNKLYNFTLSGVNVQGWHVPRLQSEIINPVQYMEYNHKDYLFITDKDGHLMITDRRGTTRIKPQKPISNSSSKFYRNRTYKKGAFLTSDRQGRVVFIQENGSLSFVSLNKFSDRHWFAYDDLRGDGTPLFLFYDRNTLYYYDKSFKLVYTYRFLHDTPSPHLLKTINGKMYIGIFSPAEKEVFLFDKNGLVAAEPNIRGTTPFDLGNVSGSSDLNLVIGSGKSLKVFRLTQL